MNFLALLAAAALAAPNHGAGTGSEVRVDMPGRFFTPSDTQALVGDTVAWHNSDHATHTVVADDGTFRSERLGPGGEFRFRFTEPGVHAYHCSVHRSMRGSVRVAALGLTGPSAPLAHGAMARLEVLAPAGATSVVLERRVGAAWEGVAEVAPGADGRAGFHVEALEPSEYRARTGDLTSAVARVRVAPEVTAVARRTGRRVSVRASVTPPQPGATVTLKRYVRERFAYVPVVTRRSADGGEVAFTLRNSRRLAFRVRVSKAPGGWSPADSRHVSVPSLRR